MFRFFRRRDTLVRWFLGGLLVLVCVMMVVTLIPGLSTPVATGDTAVLATVVGEPITVTELQQQFQQLSRNNELPPNALATYAPEMLIRMVEDQATLHEARRMGLRVTDTEIAEQLRDNPYFFTDGQFVGEERFRNIVEQRFGMNENQFWQKLREAALSDKLRRIVTDNVTISDAELDREYHRRNDKIRIQYVLLKPADFTSQVPVTDDNLKGFFQNKRTDYSIPEKRNLKLLYVDLEKVRESVEVTEPEIRQFYERNKDRFRVEDRVQVSHILLKTVGKTPEQAADLEKTAKELVEKVRAGEDFAALAKKYSEDAGSKAKGGDLGWIVRGQTVPEFEKAAFSLEPGRVSDVIKTLYGFHVLKVTARERAHQQSLEEVRPQLLSQAKQEKGERAAQEAGDRVETALHRHGKNLEALAGALNVPLLEATGHARGEPLAVVGASASLDDAAFSLKAGETSPVVNTGKGLVVLRVERIIASHPSELAEVRARLENDYRKRAAVELAQREANVLLVRARNLHDLKKAAEELKLPLKTSEAFTEEGSIPELGPVASFASKAFAMKVGDIGDPEGAPDKSFVYSVAEQILATAEETAKGRSALRTELLDRKRNIAFQVFREGLKERLEKEGQLKPLGKDGKFQPNLAALQRLTRSSQ